MSSNKDLLKETVGFNLSTEQKEVLKIMAEYLHMKGIIEKNTFAEAARWSISTIGTMIREVVVVEMSGKVVTEITIPLKPVDSNIKLAQHITPESQSGSE